MATRFNLRLLLILAAILGLAIPCAMIQHERQSARLSQQLREQARQEMEEGRPDRAAPILERYLMLNPGDMERLADYALLLGRLPDAAQHQGRQRAALENVLAHNPAQASCRRRLAEVLYDMGDAQAALQHIEQLRRSEPADATMLTLEGRCHEALDHVDQATQAYDRAIQTAPTRAEAYVYLAMLSLRQSRSQEALHVVDDLVKALPNRPDTYLLRSRLQLSLGHLTEADVNLRQYLAQQGDKQAPDYLQTQAELASRRGDLAGARRDWEQALGLRPGNLELTLGLARLDLAEGHAAEALDWVNRALAAHPGQPGLIHLKVEALAILGQWEIAQGAIDPLRTSESPHGLASYLDARLLIARGLWAEAAALLEDVTHVEALPPELEPKIYLQLALCRGQLGQRDAEAKAYQKASELDPNLTAARLGRARAEVRRALAGTGSADKDAETTIRWAAQRPAAAAGAALLLADLRLARGRRVDAKAAFAEIRQMTGYAELAEIWLAEARWQAAVGDSAEAARVLVRAEAQAQLKDRLDLRVGSLEVATWLPYDDAAALLHSLVPEPADLPRFLGRYLRKAAAARPVLISPILLETSDQLLDAGNARRSSLPVSDQLRLLRQEALAWARLGYTEEAARARRRLAIIALPDLPYAIYLLDVALEDIDVNAATAAVERFDRLGANGEAWARLGRAARLLLRSGDAASLAAARQLLDQQPAEPAAAARAIWMKALLDNATGHPDAALAGYLQVAQRGNVGLPLLTLVIPLLRERQRYAEADRLFEQAEGTMLLRDNLAWLAADCALRAGRPERAVLLARRGVSAGMAVNGQVQLGRFLAQAGHPAAAESVLREGAAKATTMGPWLELIDQLMNMGQAKEAAVERVHMVGAVPVPDQMLALACADEILGHWTEAAREFEQAAQAAPGSEPARVGAARFYLRAAQPQAALPHLTALFPAVPYGDDDNGRVIRSVARLAAGPTLILPDSRLPWARRELALTLVDVDPRTNRQRALNLVGSDAGDLSPGESALNGRARAFIQATDPTERGRMRSILESQTAAMNPEELFRLAQLTEMDGDAGRALALARQAWEADKGNPEYLASVIRRLIKMNQRPEAERLLALLVVKEGDSERCRELRLAIEKP